MNASRRLLSEMLVEAASSWSRPLSPKEVIVTGSTLGATFVLLNQWATGVQLDAHKEVVSAELRAKLKTELGALRNDMTGQLGAMTGQLGAMFNDMKAELGAIRNDMKTATR